jgi:hypothetical protein
VQDLHRAGFEIQYINCSATNVKVFNSKKKSDTSFGYGVGFGWAPDSRIEFRIITANKITYTNCTSIKCQVGFDTWFHTTSLWKNVKTICCKKTFLYNPQGTRTLSCNPCSECNPDIIVTLNNIYSDNKYCNIKIKKCKKKKYKIKHKKCKIKHKNK